MPSLNCDFTVVFDNEPRNKEICKLIKKTIKSGVKICLWPDTMKYKDINDMILGGYTKEEVQKIIKNNTYQSASAAVRFATWRKIND
jgi:hypothetical protein